MKKIYVFFLGLFFLAFDSLGQDTALVFSDSLAFQQELIVQKEIDDLEYRFRINLPDIPDSLRQDSLYSFVFEEEGWISKNLSDWTQSEHLNNQLIDFYPELQYLVFGEVAGIDGARTYFATLLETGDIVLGNEPQKTGEDLVLVASRDSYEPLIDYKFNVLLDYKLFWVTVIVLFFLTSAGSMIVFMLIFKSRRNQREESIKQYESVIIGPLTALLFEKERDEIYRMTQEDLEKSFSNTFLKRPLFKEVMIELIIGLNKKMKGDFKDKLKIIYKKAGLVEVTLSNLKSRKWDSVTTGLVQVNEMDLVELLSEVKVHANSSNFYVRSQAGATLLNLSEKVDLDFLVEQKFILSEWQQMTYFRIIKFIHTHKKLKIQKLFESDNQSVRVFGIKLIRMLGRVDLLESLRLIIPKASDEERLELLRTYDALGAHMEVDFINESMGSSNPDVQSEAILVAGSLGNEESAVIIKRLLDNNSDFQQKKMLLESLYKLDSVEFEIYVDTHKDRDVQTIKDHVLDPNLQNV